MLQWPDQWQLIWVVWRREPAEHEQCNWDIMNSMDSQVLFPFLFTLFVWILPKMPDNIQWIMFIEQETVSLISMLKLTVWLFDDQSSFNERMYTFHNVNINIGQLTWLNVNLSTQSLCLRVKLGWGYYKVKLWGSVSGKGTGGNT